MFGIREVGNFKTINEVNEVVEDKRRRETNEERIERENKERGIVPPNFADINRPRWW